MSGAQIHPKGSGAVERLGGGRRGGIARCAGGVAESANDAAGRRGDVAGRAGEAAGRTNDAASRAGGIEERASEAAGRGDDVAGRASEAASRVRIAFLLLAAAIGAIYSWASRNSMNADGISYLDIGDAYLHGRWGAAINAYWSPLYSWLLGLANAILRPPPRWEFPVAHLVTFLGYLAALASFDLLLGQFLRFVRMREFDPARRPSQMPASLHAPTPSHAPALLRTPAPSQMPASLHAPTPLRSAATAVLPDWAILALGYTLFIYFTTAYVTLRLVTPDLIVSSSVYLACALLIKTRLGEAGRATYVGLGLVLGLGYLSKAAMFGLGIVFLVLAWFASRSIRDSRTRMRKVAVAFVVFLAIAAPLIGAISIQQDRLTFGESGRLNYAWFVNGVQRFAHWQGGPPGNGVPKHSTRQTCANPPVYEYGSPVAGTYPPWYDPAYWYDGLEIRLDGGELARAVFSNVKVYWQLVKTTQLALLIGAAILIAIGLGKAIHRQIVSYWMLLIPGFAGLATYLAVTRFQDPRYIGPFLVVLWLPLLAGLRPRTDSSMLETGPPVVAGARKGRTTVARGRGKGRTAVVNRRAEAATAVGGWRANVGTAVVGWRVKVGTAVVGWRVNVGTAVVVVVAAVQILLAPPASDTLYPPASVARTATEMLEDAFRGVDPVTDISARVALALQREGVRPGDPIAVVGDPFEQYWARLARVRIVAEVASVRGSLPGQDTSGFWDGSRFAQTKALDALRRSGAMIAITKVHSRGQADHVSSFGWRPIGDTNLYGLTLQE